MEGGGKEEVGLTAKPKDTGAAVAAVAGDKGVGAGKT